jgi:hypothetical protein
VPLAFYQGTALAVPQGSRKGIRLQPLNMARPIRNARPDAILSLERNLNKVAANTGELRLTVPRLLMETVAAKSDVRT